MSQVWNAMRVGKRRLIRRSDAYLFAPRSPGPKRPKRRSRRPATASWMRAMQWTAAA